MFKIFKGDPAEFGVIAASFYGLRRSEVLGLRWDAIDFEEKTITIRHTVNETHINLFTGEEKKAAWEDFEPICLHDSTLSFASHALFALQNGYEEKGFAYLRKALMLDLRDVMGNTGHEGLHLACMGEAWQAAYTVSGSCKCDM